MKPKVVLLIGTAAIALLFTCSAAVAQQPGIVKYTPHMTVQSLAGRPSSDLVDLKNGHRVTVGDLRRLDELMQKLRAPKVDKTPAAFKIKPAATGIQIQNRAALATALNNRRDSETVQLPSGRVATIGQIKAVQPLVEQRLGYKLTDVPQAPNLSGPATKISKTMPKSEWQNLSKKPDSTVLELPDGKRFTVGQLRQVVAKYAERRRAMRKALPARTAPLGAPQPQKKGGAQ